jgi:pSer/pThr/pTyr-binding forkhead associated (FHA) protein
MKLVFPNGEHGQVFLSPGANKVGSDIDNAVVLNRPGILPVHCVIHITGTGANLQVPGGAGPVTVNGKPVPDIMGLRSGDSIAFGNVQAKFAVVEETKFGGGGFGDAADDTGATRVRMAIPKFVLRGVSGAVFSKVFPVAGPVVIGRAPECDISVPADEMSRRHALVKPTPDGLQVEDLGSSNGTYINNKRIQTGFLGPGDELRLDAVRFILVAPGMEIPHGTPPTPAAKPSAAADAIVTNKKIQLAAMVLTFAALAIIVAMLVMKGAGKG